MAAARTLNIVAVLLVGFLLTVQQVALAQNSSIWDTVDANALNQQVIQLYNQGRYSDAIPLAQHALALREKALGHNHPDIAQSLYFLASLYAAQGRYADAEPLFKRSIAINEKTWGPDNGIIALSLNNLASLYFAHGRYADAEQQFKRSIGILEKEHGPDHPNVATLLNNLAEVYRAEGRYVDAEPLYKRSLAAREKVLGPEHPDVSQSLNNLALVYSSQARYADAEPLFERSIAILEKTSGPDHPNVAKSLNNLAEVYRAEGRYADAEPLYKRALTIQEKVLGSDHPDVATSQNNLAAIYSQLGRYDDAESYFKRSLATREKALGSDHPDFAMSLNNLAEFYRVRGRYAEAEQSYKRSLAISEKALGPDHPSIGISLNNLADLYLAEGRYIDALLQVRSAAQKGLERKSVYLAVLTRAAANSLIKNADALDEGYQVVQRETSSAASNAINQLSVRFAAGNDQLAELVRKDQDLSSENERLDKLIIEAVSKEPSKRDAANEHRIKDRLQALVSERAQIQATLNQRFPDFAIFSKPAPLSLRDTQALLAEDEALIVLDFDRHSYGEVITRSSADGGELSITAKNLEAQVKTLRASLNKPFDVRASYELYKSIFGSLADKFASKKRLSVVMNGALTSLPLQLLVTKDPTGKKLKDVDWLVRSYATTVLPSVASLKVLRTRAPVAPAAKPMIAFADPVFSKTARMEARQRITMRGMTSFVSGTQLDIGALAENLPQLPSTRDEVQTIAKTLQVDPSDIKLGLDATVTAVKEAKLDQYRVVYFATHGLVAGYLQEFAKGKVEPALALSIPDKATEFDNGLLSASEVAQLRLNADWVVLSACNTAAEEEPGAEALSGLARAFFYAGARSLLVSHWEVDDEATAKLMTKIFLLMGDNPKLSHGEALQQAILAIMDSATSDDDLNPRLWAPFVVVGEPQKR